MKPINAIRIRIRSVLVFFQVAAFVAPSAHAGPLLTTLYSFSGTTNDGANPYGGLVQASDGMLYGTTLNGGELDAGTVFKLTTNGLLTTFYAFTNGDDEASPAGKLLEGADGTFYGTTEGGNAFYGTVFNITTNGVLTTLHSFSGLDGANPYAGLIDGGDGYFYGTTSEGGTNFPSCPACPPQQGEGTVFKIDAQGDFTNLYTFNYAFFNAGDTPYAELALGTNGNFYGTTTGALFGAGAVFEISSSGALTVLVSSGDNFLGSYGSLVLGTNGNFYGTTFNIDGVSSGSVFEMEQDDSLTNLYSFTGGHDGDAPEASLVQTSDGNFYGTTSQGGTNNQGTVFSIISSGTFTRLYSFTGGADGGNPRELTLASDGNLYGTTEGGGEFGKGTIFRINLAGTSTQTNSMPVISWNNPAAITYGTPLSSNELDSTANVPGGFAYNPTNGTVLNAGTNTLSVIFTPTDTVDYSSATDTVRLVVSPASLTAIAADSTRAYGQSNPPYSGTISGVTNGDNITAIYSCSATTNSPPGAYPIVPSLVDPNNRETNYTVSLFDGTLTITPVSTPACTPAPMGLVLWWDFAGGSAKDVSGFSNDGIVNGDVLFTNGTAVFNNPPGGLAATEWIEVPYSQTIEALETNSFTVGIHYESTDTTQGNGRLFGNTSFIAVDYSSAAESCAFTGIAGGGGFIVIPTNYPTCSNTAQTTDGLTHWQVISFDQSNKTATQYVDATNVAAASIADSVPAYLNGLVLGTGGTNDSYGALQTSVKDLCIFNRALASNEVAAICAAGSAGLCALPKTPVFTNIQLNQGGLAVSVAGVNLGQAIILEASTNFINWIPLRTNSAAGPTLTISNIFDATRPAEFFRAIAQ